MLKQVIALIILSIIIILCMPYAQQALQWVVSAHDWIAQTLTQVFSGGQVGDAIRKLIALLVLPVAIGLVPVIIFWLAKHRWFPYFMQVVWVVWLAQTAALIIQYKAGT